MDDATPTPEGCVSCGRALKPESAFCGDCGHRRGEPPVDRAAKVKVRLDRVRRIESGWGGIRAVIFFYVGLLLGQAASMLVAHATNEFTADLGGTAILAAIILLAASMNRDAFPPGRGAGFGPRGYGLVFLAAIPIVLVVAVYVHGLSRLFPIPTQSYLEPYQGRSPAWAYFLVAVAPAFFEELAFRGVIFGLLRRSLNPRETILLSAVAFGLLHLSVPMLLTHVPLGIYLGWLRHRSGSLYPSMVAHFLHNAFVVTAEVWALGPGWLSS